MDYFISQRLVSEMCLCFCKKKREGNVSNFGMFEVHSALSGAFSGTQVRTFLFDFPKEQTISCTPVVHGSGLYKPWDLNTLHLKWTCVVCDRTT